MNKYGYTHSEKEGHHSGDMGKGKPKCSLVLKFEHNIDGERGSFSGQDAWGGIYTSARYYKHLERLPKGHRLLAV